MALSFKRDGVNAAKNGVRSEKLEKNKRKMEKIEN